MNETAVKKKKRLSEWFLLCPVRHTLSLIGCAVIAAYFLLRGRAGLMEWLSVCLVRPWHAFWGGVCNVVSFSVAGAIIAVVCAAVLISIIVQLALVFARREKLKRLYRLGITLLMVFSVVYGGFCLLWGVYYYTSDFEEQSGISASLVSTEQLQSVTAYFASLANEYGAQVSRDERGVFSEPLDGIFDRSELIFDAVAEKVPCLAGKPLRAKPFFPSRVMSLINFTGFFFPFTGEANINTDAPSCLIPSTIAHEIAHQRGVAAEDEANFVAVLACLEDGDPVYCYSASLMAYIYLGNALYSADKQAWQDVYSTLNEFVRADLSENNAYWEQFETAVSTVSDAVYTGFLQSYGQELGLKTYGACVDLLVTYYYEISCQG